MKKELEDRKKETDRLAQLLSDENDKRIRESEAIQQRLQREKEELRQYLEEDNNKKLRYDPYPYSNDPYHRAYFYNYYNYIQGYKYGYPVSNYQCELAQYSRNSYRNQGRR